MSQASRTAAAPDSFRLLMVSMVCPGRRRGAIELFISDRFLNSLAPELENAALIYGMYSRIEREMGVTPQHVAGVAKGKTYSKRVSDAIQDELARLRTRRVCAPRVIDDARADRIIRAARAELALAREENGGRA